jgi:hypothetical protein
MSAEDQKLHAPNPALPDDTSDLMSIWRFAVAV